MIERLKRRWPLLLLTLATMGWMIWSLVQIESSEGSVRALDSNTIVMTSGDLRGLLVAAEGARAEADALREVISAERSTARGCSLRAEVLAAAIEAERASWRELEAAMNAELRTARREKVSWGITGLAFGVVAGALVQ